MNSGRKYSIDDLKASLIEGAGTILAIHDVYGSEVRKKSLAAFGKMVHAHLLVTGVVGTVLMRTNGKVMSPTPVSARRNALFGSFVLGLSLCEKAICEGYYLQAGALIRQEMETLAALNEVTSGTRKDGVTPQMRALEPSIRRLYGDFSAVAHVAQHDLASSLISEDRIMEGATLARVTRHYPRLRQGGGAAFVWSKYLSDVAGCRATKP